jgi:hypothetical protein
VGRRRFDHLHAELSVALGQLVPRYALWLYLNELGWNPERLTRGQAVVLCDEHLESFLAGRGWSLQRAARLRLRRTLSRFDPRFATPYETMARLGASPR